VIHYAAPDFRACYRALPAETQQLADRRFRTVKSGPASPSIQLKKVGTLWSVPVGFHYLALATEVPDGVLWFWIGTHSQHDRMIGQSENSDAAGAVHHV
jgi:hypothetical protein